MALKTKKCTRHYLVTQTPQAWRVEVDSGDLICINSSFQHSVFSIGSFPDETEFMFNEGDSTDNAFQPINDTSTILFSLSDSSVLLLNVVNSGVATFSGIGLGDSRCFTGIAVTNQINCQYQYKFSTPPDKKCIFFASYGQQSVSVNYNLDKTDYYSSICGDDSNLNDLSDYSLSSSFECKLSKPYFEMINTSNTDFDRSIQYEFTSLNGVNPVFPIFIEKVFNKGSDDYPDENRIEILYIILVCILIVAFLTVFGIYLFKMLRKRLNYSIENQSDSSSDEMRRYFGNGEIE